MQTIESLVHHLQQFAKPENIEGMKRFGINTASALGVPMPPLRELATMLKKTSERHTLAETLWRSGIHELRILATMVDNPPEVTLEQVTRWIQDVNSWDLCDQLCSKLLRKTPFAYDLIVIWSSNPQEFVRRAAFSLLATMAVHDKKSLNQQFIQYLPLILEYATDERNFVKKSVNWSLRQIGKRNPELCAECTIVARQLAITPSKSARWIAHDALRELSQYCQNL